MAVLFGCAAAVAGVGVLFYATSVLPTQWLKVERVHWNLGIEKKIVQISDIHIERNRISPSRLKSVLRAEQPDLVCLTGDFVDRDQSLLLLVPFLRALREVGVPIYAVLGNHDYRLQSVQRLIELMESFDVTVLINQTVVLDRMNLVGLDDYCTRHSDERAFDQIDDALPVIVMTHDPTYTVVATRRFDCLFAGHLHGKQFNVPFLFQLNPMGPLAASGVYKGRHRCSQGPFYISKGIGQSGINLRFLVRSEITVHEL
ncbi:metallophosphoesterase [Alicyclobacillus tengchongensis]|nr:metallophosphoesterase [Alicyclobacillus tengchongensis]